jgi:hypothetical protein
MLRGYDTMDNNGKICPLVRQGCLKDQCEFFNGMIKRCEISSLSYNAYRLVETLKGKSSVQKGQGKSPYNSQGQGNTLGGFPL